MKSIIDNISNDLSLCIQEYCDENIECDKNWDTLVKYINDLPNNPFILELLDKNKKLVTRIMINFSLSNNPLETIKKTIKRHPNIIYIKIPKSITITETYHPCSQAIEKHFILLKMNA